MIDFHCHLDLYPNPQVAIEEADAAEVYVLAVTTTPKSWRHLNKLIGGRRFIKAAVGLHPELVSSRANEVGEVCSIAQETRYVGEIGIDGSPELIESFELQKKVFEKILKHCAILGGRILSIHSRQAASEVIEALAKFPDAGIPVLHWFSGTKKELESAIRYGTWFSVGPSMVKSTKGRKLIETMPRSRILTESDGPFCRFGSRPAIPQDMIHVERALAEIWALSFEEASALIRHNFRTLVEDKRVPQVALSP